MTEVLNQMEELNGQDWYCTCKLLYEIHEKRIDSVNNQCNDKTVSIAVILLNMLIKTGEFSLFQTLLPIFNKVDDRRVLLYLAKIYYANSFPAMAVNTIMRSVKELDAIDGECAGILWKEIR